MTVVTGLLRQEAPDAEVRNGVAIVRVHSTPYDRAQLGRRALNYLTYLAARCATRCSLGGRTSSSA